MFREITKLILQIKKAIHETHILNSKNTGALLILSVLFLWVCLETAQAKINMQHSIADEIIRLHVLANSDSPQDQQLKLKVKSRIVEEMQQRLEGITDLAKARTAILSSIPSLEEAAKSVIAEEGYAYSVTGKLEQTWFPEKTYGDMTFPAGKYEALRIQIGAAGGRNWWCVLFPSLCFVDETYAVVPEDSKDRLKDSLSEDEYDMLLDDEETDVKIGFRIGEWWDSITK